MLSVEVGIGSDLASTARPGRVPTIPGGAVAQSGLEQGAFNPRVAGSNPARPTSVADRRVAAMKVVEFDGPGGGWRVLVPETRRERMRGLRGHPPPGPREAMLLRDCRSVHTFGMTRPLEVAFL